MPKKPQRVDSSAPVAVQVRVPSSVKNRMVDAAEAEGVSLNVWCLNAFVTVLNSGLAATAPVAPVVTAEQVVRDYLNGERTLGPCGEIWPCPGADTISDHGGYRWCDKCGIRLT